MLPTGKSLANSGDFGGSEGRIASVKSVVSAKSEFNTDAGADACRWALPTDCSHTPVRQVLHRGTTDQPLRTLCEHRPRRFRRRAPTLPTSRHAPDANASRSMPDRRFDRPPRRATRFDPSPCSFKQRRSTSINSTSASLAKTPAPPGRGSRASPGA
jgi:hypothetical protein